MNIIINEKAFMFVFVFLQIENQEKDDELSLNITHFHCKCFDSSRGLLVFYRQNYDRVNRNANQLRWQSIKPICNNNTLINENTKEENKNWDKRKPT